MRKVIFRASLCSADKFISEQIYRIPENRRFRVFDTKTCKTCLLQAKNLRVGHIIHNNGFQKETLYLSVKEVY